MPFITQLDKDVLTIICDYVGIDPTFYYYKQIKRSKNGFKNIKLQYKCSNCNKIIRNLKTSAYGFILENYDYYNVEMPEYYVNKSDISKFYHSKYRNIREGNYRIEEKNEELRLRLDKTNGELDETRAYHYVLRMRNVWDDGKVLGKIILKTILSIRNVYDKFYKEKRKLERYNIPIIIEMEERDSYINKIKDSVLNNNKNINLGYHCMSCIKDTAFSSFLKF